MRIFARTIVAATLALALPAAAQPLLVSSSETLAGVSDKWAAAFKAGHPEAAIAVARGTTAAAFEALARKKATIAVAPRSMQFKEAEACRAAFGQRAVEYKAAVSAVAVYIHTNNPVAVLTYDELFAVFTGKCRNWKQVGGQDARINVYGQSSNSMAGELFIEEVLNRKDLGSEVRLMSDADVIKTVATDTNAIGFAAFVAAGGARALPIKRAFSSTPAEPSPEAFSDRIYPITRFVFCYVDPAANQEAAKAFLEWIRSDEGQQVAAKAGYWPLASKWRASP